MWLLDIPPSDVLERGCGRGWPLSMGLLGAAGSSGLMMGIRKPEGGPAYFHLEASRCPKVGWPWCFCLTCFFMPDQGAEKLFGESPSSSCNCWCCFDFEPGSQAPCAKQAKSELSQVHQGGVHCPPQTLLPRPSLAGARRSPRNTSNVLEEESLNPLALSAGGKVNKHLTDIMLSERSQTPKRTCCVILFKRGSEIHTTNRC